MSQLPNFLGFDKFFLEQTELFKPTYDSPEPQELPIPDHWNDDWDEFEKLIFIKSFRPDKVIPAIQNWITNQIGR